jgi:hypothetical protein
VPSRSSDAGAGRPAIPNGSDADKIRGVIRRWIGASLAGDAALMCALVDPATLSDLEPIHMPCEELQSGTLTPASERDERSVTVSSVGINGNRRSPTRARYAAGEISSCTVYTAAG